MANNESNQAKQRPETESNSQETEAQPHEGAEKLLETTENAQEVLFKAETVFPFTLFPDTVTIDREKLTIANRSFFQTATINSIPIADIQSIEANIGPFFGSVHTTSKFFSSNPRTVNFLWRADAIKMQRLVQGYIIASEREIDCSAVNNEELIVLLNDLGQGVSD